MNNADLQSIVDRFLTAAPAIITSARSHTLNRSCMICGAVVAANSRNDVEADIPPFLDRRSVTDVVRARRFADRSRNG